MRLKVVVLSVFLALLQHPASAQSIVRFHVSRPYSLLSFLEVAGGLQNHSVTFRQYLDTAISKTDTVFNNIVSDFSRLILTYYFRRDEYPSNRRQTRSTYDLIVIAAVRSRSMAEFRANTIGILPNSTHQQLYELLVKAAPYYERVVWQKSAKAVKQQMGGFIRYAGKSNELFRAFRTFYRSSWPDDIPFEVAVFPIPVTQGNTTATPHANSLCVSVLTGQKNLAGTMGVVMHELCHVLYDEQTSDVQFELDEVFTKSKSPYAAIAYSFFDEAMATALGNGWAYEQFSGKPDTTAWYNNEYIDGFAHALYPLVREYLGAGRAIDSFFVERAIDLFAKNYPRALADYSILLNNMVLYSDSEGRIEREALKNELGKYFQSSRYNLSSPILHEYSLQYIKTSKSLQLIVIDRNQDTTISELKKILPELEPILKGQQAQNYIAAFYDQANRPVIVIRVADGRMLDKAFSRLKERRYLDVNMPVIPLD
ncbi:MAG: hypothetical protein J0H92_13225 [Sphingobacteriales bacterium]|nr:hypothetical protein [Sphingobacteriales bacterium]OJW37331.1 MAG: hypothetical protein BGO54_12025 [Sphingobacteriales bacterium 46-32]